METDLTYLKMLKCVEHVQLVPIEDDEYLNKMKPGLCIIISQENVDEVTCNNCYMRNKQFKEQQKYHMLDVTQLSEIFSQFEYDVRVYKNLENEEISQLMDDLFISLDRFKEPPFCPESRKEKFFNYASLVVCLLGFGPKGAVFGINSNHQHPRFTFINRLKKSFCEAFCHGLKNKPRIFIVPACRGRWTEGKSEKMNHGLLALNNDDMFYDTTEDPTLIQRWNEGTLSPMHPLSLALFEEDCEEVKEEVKDYVSFLCDELLKAAKIETIESPEEALEVGVVSKKWLTRP